MIDATGEKPAAAPAQTLPQPVPTPAPTPEVSPPPTVPEVSRLETGSEVETSESETFPEAEGAEIALPEPELSEPGN